MTIHLKHHNAGDVTLTTGSSGTVTLTLPVTDGNANEALVTDGNGVLSFAPASGNTTSEVLYEHAHTISSAYSITSGNNALSAGPITVATGGSVTVPTGSAWTVV